MGLLRRRRVEVEEPPDSSGDDAEPGRPAYSRTMTDRMRTLDTYSYVFDESEADAVEARLRRMFYGAKIDDE